MLQPIKHCWHKFKVKLCNRDEVLTENLKELDRKKYLQAAFNQYEYDDVITRLKYSKVVCKELLTYDKI